MDMIMSKNVKQVPFHVQDIDRKTSEELMSHFTGEYSGFVRVGPKGYLLPKRYEQETAGFYNMTIRSDDVFIVTFPRSGTTLTQELMWLMASDLDYETAANILIDDRFPFLEHSILFHPTIIKNLEDKITDEEDKELIKKCSDSKIDWLEDLPSPRFIKSHLPPSLLPHNLLDARVVFVARDPRDVAVSYYHLSQQSCCFGYEGDFKTYWNFFIQNLVVYSPMNELNKEGWNLRNHPNMLFLFYEDLVTDLRGSIKKMAKILKKELSDKQIEELYDHVQIDKFRNNTSMSDELYIKSGLLKPGKEPFIRKGKVGGWRDYFDEEMSKQAAQWMEENLRDTDLRYPAV